MREREIRTPDYNLYFCKAIITDDKKLFFEFKNGKRVERIPAETILAEINDFMQECSSELHIEIK